MLSRRHRAPPSERRISCSSYSSMYIFLSKWLLFIYISLSLKVMDKSLEVNAAYIAGYILLAA